MFNFEDGRLGNCFVKFLDPINIQQYLAENKWNIEQQQNLESISLHLSEKLYTAQQVETPITLNSIVSTFLLQEREKQLSIEQLLRCTDIVYRYINRAKN
jgi:glycerol-3-phosphate O-acyltransferase